MFKVIFFGNNNKYNIGIYPRRFGKVKKRIKKKIEMGKKEKIISKICVAFSILLIMGVMFMSVINKSNLNIADVKEDRVEEKSVMNEDIKKQENTDTKNSSVNDYTNKDSDEVKSKEKDETTDAANTSTIDLTNIVRPVKSAEIIMEYSYNTTPVYSKTLEEYTSDHKGIDLKSYKNENVKCILDGKVNRVYYDQKLGYTVEVDHGNNFYSIYSNLNKKLNVKKGDKLNRGDVIGSVGKTASFEISDDYHLHFEIKRNGDTVNPSSFLQ